MPLKQPTKQSERHVEAVLAACDIADTFLRFPNQTLKHIIDQTHLTRNRVMRLTGTLEARGYLVRDPAKGVYMLGPRIMSLGRVYERQSNLGTLAQPILEELAATSGESASINIQDNLDRVVFARVEGSSEIRLSIPVGQRVPLNLGATGKVILAFGRKEVRDKVLKRICAKMSGSDKRVAIPTMTAELNKTAIQGYAYGPGERVMDAGVISAPVFGPEGFLGALTIAGPIQRFTPENLSERIKLVKGAAAKLTWLLGGNQSISPRTPESRIAEQA
jgi:IclR family transcriptional regulator, KDG regulon repressor